MATFSGELTVGKDAELKHLPSGKAVIEFSAVNNLYTGKDKERVALWLKVKLFDPTDYQQTAFKKGVTVSATGQLGADTWTDSQGVAKVSYTLNCSFPNGHVGVSRLPQGSASYPSAEISF